MALTIKVGLIGYGMAGQVFHAPIITSVPGLQLVKIRETKLANIALAKNRYPQTQLVPNSENILTDPEIDLVVIATPNTSHFPLAKAALLAGKHVVVDKPFTITPQEADDLIALAEKQEKLLTVYHNRRWDSNSQTVKKIIDSKLLGNLVEFEAHFDRFRNFIKEDAWRETNEPGSGILYDLGAHLLDEAQNLFGLPEFITADIRTQRAGGQTDDNFEVILHYGSLKVTLKAGMLVREPGPNYILHGDLGSYIKYGGDVQEAALKNGQNPVNNLNWGEEPIAQAGKLTTTFQGLNVTGTITSEKGDYPGFYRNVYNAIIGEEPLAVTPQQARNTIRLIELAFKSSAEKRTLSFTN